MRHKKAEDNPSSEQEAGLFPASISLTLAETLSTPTKHGAINSLFSHLQSATISALIMTTHIIYMYV